MVAVPGVFVVFAVALVRRGAMSVIPRVVSKVCAASLVASVMARLIRTLFVLMIAMHTHIENIPPRGIFTKLTANGITDKIQTADRKTRKALPKSCRATKGAPITITTSDSGVFSHCQQ